MPVHIGNFVTKRPMIGSEWPPTQNWRANNNTLGDWDTCFTPPTSELPQHMTATFGTNPSLNMLAAQQPGEAEKMELDVACTSPKQDGRKSSEHTNSYDVSASQSPSNDADSTSEEHIDVESTTQSEKVTTVEKGETSQKAEEPEVKTPVPTLPAPIPITPVVNGEQRQPTLEESILLSLQQHQFQEVIDEAAKIRNSESSGFKRSNTSAFSNIEPKEGARPPSAPPAIPTDPPAPTAIVPNNSSAPSSASFCRPPGLGPVALPPPKNGQLVCPICGFMCPSKFHFNSHMNTHGDHQCSMCDYTSRTEGRLKKHMRESHTAEEQLRAGLELEPTKESNGSSSSPKGTSQKDSSSTSPVHETFNLSTTMASLLDSTNSAIAAIAHTDLPSSLPAALNLDLSATPTLLSTLSQSSITSSALDQIKAFAENTNLLPENGISLASALGAVSQAMKGEPSSPEKQSSSGEGRRSNSGKQKILKCKQCGHTSLSKNEQWAHSRTHIPAEKQLNCQHCNFVTEYKHHLEYHYRNHIGSKPFQCKKCSYTCVNKSMLNSHMKSHTNHYQFRCMDCTYATKYCHSLKLHLKKYNHRRVPEGIELSNGESSSSLGIAEPAVNYNPSNVKQEIKTEPIDPVTSIAQPFAFNPMMSGGGLNLANQLFLNKHLEGGFMSIPGLRNPAVQSFKCAVCDVVCSTQEDHMRHSMSHLLNTSAVPTTIASLYSTLNLPTLRTSNPESEDFAEPIEVDIKVEDDASPDSQHDEEMMDQSSELTASPAESTETALSSEDDSKKGRSMSLDQLSNRLRGSTPTSVESVPVREDEVVEDDVHLSPCDTTSAASPPQNPVNIVAPIPIAAAPDASVLQALLQQATMAFTFANRSTMFTCNYCNINFGNQPAYNSHMTAHCFESPFKCNKCGHISSDSLSFAIHQFQLCRNPN